MDNKLEFETLKFLKMDDTLRVFFQKFFYFEIPLDELLSIGEFETGKHWIEFKGVSFKKADTKFGFLISKYITKLKSVMYNKDAIYVHRNSGLELIGNGSFGILDRDTNCIEIKPVTGCNLACVYCSVNPEAKNTDFIVEPEYMAEELEKLIALKKSEDIEIHIGCQGEPLLYESLAYMIGLISKIPRVERISMDTNGLMLTQEKIDELVEAGLTQFNVSLDSLNTQTASDLAARPYDTEKIKNVLEMISKKCDLVIAPLIVPGKNEEDMIDIIKFTKTLMDNGHRIRLGIQKFLSYQFGKNPAKENTWDAFFDKLREQEKEFGIPLIWTAEDFLLKKDKVLERPFRKGQVVKAEIVSDGRVNREKIAVAQGRNISIANCRKESGMVKIKLMRDKHNVFFGIEP